LSSASSVLVRKCRCTVSSSPAVPSWTQQTDLASMKAPCEWHYRLSGCSGLSLCPQFFNRAWKPTPIDGRETISMCESLLHAEGLAPNVTKSRAAVHEWSAQNVQTHLNKSR
jgi:hypothetical protein